MKHLESMTKVALMQRVLQLEAQMEQQAHQLSFQARVREHMDFVAGNDPTDMPERRDRFGEESIELQQAFGARREDVHALVDYVFDREVGDPRQEMGGSMTTLFQLASYTGMDALRCGEIELRRTWTPEIVAKIRRKRSKRSGRGPLPGADFVPGAAA